jgi:predicted small lipoprotein YifL
MTSSTCIAAALAALAILAGCGKGEPEKKPVSTPVAAKKADPAKPADGSPPPRCPVKVETALTGPDVVGLKVGMLAEER